MKKIYEMKMCLSQESVSCKVNTLKVNEATDEIG